MRTFRLEGATSLYLAWLVIGAIVTVVGLTYVADDLVPGSVLVAVGIVLAVVGVRGHRSRVLAYPDKLVISNVFRTVTLDRTDVTTIRVWPERPDKKVAPRVVIDSVGRGSVIPTALQLGGALTTADARFETATRVASELTRWKANGDAEETIE